jgi:hypothetical protein
MPTISGDVTFFIGTTANIDVNFHSILDHLKLAGMRSIEIKGSSWGAH